MMPRRLFPLYIIVLVLAAGALLQAEPASKKSGVHQQPFGTHDGRPVTLYTLTNSHGVEVRAMSYGGIILSIRVPDRKGQLGDIVLGHETLEGYTPNPPFLGAIVGRYANRIANGTFTLDGKPYNLPKNDGP